MEWLARLAQSGIEGLLVKRIVGQRPFHKLCLPLLQHQQDVVNFLLGEGRVEDGSSIHPLTLEGAAYQGTPELTLHPASDPDLEHRDARRLILLSLANVCSIRSDLIGVLLR